MNTPSEQPRPKPVVIQMTDDAAVSDMIARALDCAKLANRRILIGIAGGPGSGKSTLSAKVLDQLNQAYPGSAALLPMDGFHRLHADLVTSGEVKDKGAPHTFDAAKFIATLREVKTASEPVGIPSYSRKIEDVVPNAFSIEPTAQIIVVEGNYLLLAGSPWEEVGELLDLAIFVHVPRDKVRARLLKRHAEHGLFSQERNIAHIDSVDLANYDLVEQHKFRADVIINLITER